MNKLYCVRAMHGKYARSFFEGGYVAIGWLEDDDLGEVHSRDDVERAYRKRHKDEHNNYVIGQQVGQISRFLLEMEGGDYVIVPGEEGEVYFGQIVPGESYYYFTGEDDCPFPHRRHVKWYKEPFWRMYLYGGLVNRMHSNLTVFLVNEPNFLEMFQRDMKSSDDKWQGVRDADDERNVTIGFKQAEMEEVAPAPEMADMKASAEATDLELMTGDVSAEVVNIDGDGVVTLFYGTTRNRTGSKQFNDYYGSDFDAGNEVVLKRGICKVSIPPRHEVGEIERPKKILWMEFREQPGKHVMVTDIAEMTGDDFHRCITERVSASTNKSALIFIHGYNNDFAECARRAAQITYDIPFNENVSGFFSWPSDGATLSYVRDQERANASVTAFADFIEQLVVACGIEELHFIAHSMGNQLLTRGLLKLKGRPSFSARIKAISQIVLAAPDIDQTTFKTEILPEFKEIGRGRTVYASKKDRALLLSEGLRRGLARLGDAGDDLFVAHGVETIDASHVETGLSGHSYVFEEKETLADLFYLINHGITAEERQLERRIKEDVPYYVFRR